LDVGEGRDLDLPECLRSKLQKEHIRYLGPAEREHYEVIIEDGKLYYKLNGCPVDTPKPDRWIFVMSPAGKFYVGPVFPNLGLTLCSCSHLGCASVPAL
jgi:hypothetical protein